MQWEEDPRYQKQQAAGVGLLLILLFINGLVVAKDSDGRFQVLVYFLCFLAAAAALPLIAWGLIKLLNGGMMNGCMIRPVFVTPPRRTVTLILLSATVILSPAAVTYFYFIRMLRGDYSTDSDSIGIPVAFHFLLVYIPTLYLVVAGLRRYSGGVSLFSWPSHPPSEPTPDRKVFSTVASLSAFISDIGLIADASSAGLPAFAIYFVLHLSCVAILRATSVNPGSATPAR